MTKAQKKQIGRDRLRALAALLRVVPDEKFCMLAFVGEKQDDNGVVIPMRFPDRVKAHVSDCGTVACAMGHAIFAFPQLRYTENGQVWVEDRLHFDELEAAEDFFRITARQAAQLFTPPDMGSVTKDVVIDRIEAMANR